jgi:nucleoside-diphosphate-sugar epimerase
MNVLVTGASGFIGRALTRRLLAAGHQVRALVRNSREGGIPAAAEIAVGDLLDAASLELAAQGMEGVVHLACATGVTRESVVRAVNVAGTRSLLEVARRGGARRFVFVSSVSARRRRMGLYGRSKREGEALVVASRLEWVILRPSLVYGPGPDGLFARLDHALASFPVFPVVGDGRTLLDPLDVEDVCMVIERCLTRPEPVGKSYDLLGPERVTFDDLVRRLAALRGITPRLLHVPGWAALLLARLFGVWSARPPLSEDNVLGMISPAEVDGAPARGDFPIAWTGLDQGLARLRGAA